MRDWGERKRLGATRAGTRSRQDEESTQCERKIGYIGRVQDYWRECFYRRSGNLPFVPSCPCSSLPLLFPTLAPPCPCSSLPLLFIPSVGSILSFFNPWCGPFSNHSIYPTSSFRWNGLHLFQIVRGEERLTRGKAIGRKARRRSQQSKRVSTMKRSATSWIIVNM